MGRIKNIIVTLTAALSVFITACASHSHQYMPQPYHARDEASTNQYRYDSIKQPETLDSVFIICKTEACPKTNLQHVLVAQLTARFSEDPSMANLLLHSPAATSSVNDGREIVSSPTPTIDGAPEHVVEQAAPGEGDTAIISQESMTAMHRCPQTIVYFKLDEYTLSSDAKYSIKEAAQCLMSSSSQAPAVKGFTCKIGTKEHNDKLAINRAHAVAAELQSLGVRVEEVTGEGKCCYQSDELEKNRRVEISTAN
jgi:outer membrane protein OmpA-like peptidoglycan-associated protein